MESQLVWAFPMPDDLVRAAYWNLHLSENGTEDQKRRLGPASELPRPWDIATCMDPDLRAAVWHWYTDIFTWFNHEYVWDPNAGMIPPCWALHPHLVHEIGVLADQRRRAALALNSNALEEWHRYSVPAFLDRTRERVKQHCDDEHQAWPAKSRFAASHTTLSTQSIPTAGGLRNPFRPSSRPLRASTSSPGSQRTGAGHFSASPGAEAASE